MAYNPLTNEIYVALYTNCIQENRGCIYVMDPDTLGFKRKIKISDSYNILGIGYKEDTNQYVIQTNVDGNYSFKVLDENFQIVEELGEYAHTAKGDNFQDLVVSGDYILNFPLTLSMGIGDFLHVYSISERQMVADPQIDFQFENIAADEPESLCELEPGVFLCAVNLVDTAGNTSVRFYETTVPYYFYVTTMSKEGKLLHREQVLRGTDYAAEYQAEEGWQVASLSVNGREVNAEDNQKQYVLQDVRQDYTVEVGYEKVPMFSFAFPDRPKMAGNLAGGAALLLVCGGAGMAGYYLHIKMERKRKYLRAKRRRVYALEY